MPSRKPEDSPVYQLKLTLRESKPPIWRRLQVRGSTTLAKLHQILQVVMGWTDSHLHQFIVDGVSYGIPDPEWPDFELKNERRVKLGQLVTAVDERFVYEYDFGDSWEHALIVERILPAEPGVRYPICLAGQQACPPEDVGGIGGYADFVEAIQHPAHPEHAAMRTWVGRPFDAAAFDVETVNHALKYL